MLIKISRILFLLLIVFVSSIFIPKYYWLKFEKNVRRPMIYYSPVSHDFLFSKLDGKELFYVSRKGNKYDRDQFEKLTPLLNYRQLVSVGKLPDSLNGVAINIETVRLNNIMMRVTADELDVKPIPLFPLFESKSGRVKLEMPDDYFRISDRFEFLDCQTNSINQDKSSLFTSALSKENFSFPATKIAGNPTNKKPFDEGYFVLDSKNKLYHIKMIKGKPFCVNINMPQSLDIAYMKIFEMSLREFYGLLFTKQGDVFLISYDNYKLIKLPLDNYNIQKDNFSFLGDQFYRTLSLTSAKNVRTIVTDRNYKVIDRYEDSWADNYDMSAGAVASTIFPYTLRLSDASSSFSNFYFRFSGFQSLLLSFLLTIVTYFILRIRKISLKQGWFDLIIVLITGIFGFIAVLLVKNIDNNN
jgi:hypothetical protein